MRPPAALAAVAVAALLAAACSSGGGDGDRAAGPSSSAATTGSSSAGSDPASTGTTVDEDGCPAVPPPAVPDQQRPSYAVEATVDPEAGTIGGTLRARFTPDLPTDRLVFRLWPNGPRPAGAGVVLDVGPVTSPDLGALASERPDPTTLVVRLPGELAAGQPVEVGLPWNLTVPGPTTDRVSKDGDSLRLGSFLPLLAWEPGVGWATDPPTAGYAEASTAPSADFELQVEVPAGYSVLGTGRAGDGGTWTAEAVRDVGLSVGRFTTATATAAAPDPVTVTVGVADGLADDPEAYAAAAVEALEDFGARYAPYPWPDLSIAVTAGLPGGIEYPATIFHGPETVDHVAHEVGHQWFYGLVGNDQGRDPWLDEGLATWAQTRVDVPPIDGLPQPVPEDATGHAGDPMTFWEGHLDSYYRGVYVQSALALHELGDDDLVDCALRHYVADRAYGIARPSDLFDALRLVFPDAEATLAPYGLAP
ncbi:MAG TPA: M1 family aminopeptidase [Acidimicrobiales bacterium]